MHISISNGWAVASWALAFLAAVTKAAGAFLPGTYRDGVWAASQMRGADLVALAILPALLAASAEAARRGSPRGVLLWLAALHLLLYDVAFYLYGAAYNDFFLAYAALSAGALVLLAAALTRLDLDALGAGFAARTPRRWPAIVLALLGLGLGGTWLAQSIVALATGTVPASVVASGHPTALVFAIDLTMLVPFFLLGAWGLWRDRPWGPVAATVVAVSGAAYTALLAGMAVGADPAVVDGATALLPLWATLGVAASSVAGSLLRHAPDRVASPDAERTLRRSPS